MTIRYGNDIKLGDYSTQAEAELKSMKAHLREGNLDSAFLRARATQKKLDKFMERLNELQPMPKLPDYYK